MMKRFPKQQAFLDSPLRHKTHSQKMKGVVVLIGAAVVIVIVLCAWQCWMRARLRELLAWGADALSAEGVDYWIDYGTLLGVVREGDVILWDNDVDFCVFDCPELQTKLWRVAQRLCDKGVVWTRVSDGIFRFYHRLIPLVIHADVYVYIRDGSVLKGPEGPKSNIEVDLIGVPQDRRWREVTLRVPERVHETLVSRYGSNYMTPKPFFKGRSD